LKIETDENTEGIIDRDLNLENMDVKEKTEEGDDVDMNEENDNNNEENGVKKNAENENENEKNSEKNEDEDDVGHIDNHESSDPNMMMMEEINDTEEMHHMKNIIVSVKVYMYLHE
jgi:hypothetical protein